MKDEFLDVIGEISELEKESDDGVESGIKIVKPEALVLAENIEYRKERLLASKKLKDDAFLKSQAERAARNIQNIDHVNKRKKELLNSQSLALSDEQFLEKKKLLSRDQCIRVNPSNFRIAGRKQKETYSSDLTIELSKIFKLKNSQDDKNILKELIELKKAVGAISQILIATYNEPVVEKSTEIDLSLTGSQRMLMEARLWCRGWAQSVISLLSKI